MTPWFADKSDERLEKAIRDIADIGNVVHPYLIEMMEEATEELERRKIARTKLGKVLE